MTFEKIFHLFIHALKDSALVLPFLILTYVLIELIQRRASFFKDGKFLSGKYAPLYGGLAGVFPQCGFSVMSAKLYEQGIIKGGTLLAVFIATSDEAFALLLANGRFLELLMLAICKFCYAVLIGFLVNAIIKWQISVKFRKNQSFRHEEYCKQCGASDKAKNNLEAYLLYPLLHALKTFAFVLAVNFIFGAFIEFVGEDKFLAFLDTNKFIQPIVCALVGLIPNCASSILITQTYIKGGIFFGSMLAGLSANAGIGLAILLKDKSKIKKNTLILAILFVSSVVLGLIINLFL